jgi:hypothetical protein
LRASLQTLERNQVATQSRLADFPRYRAVSGGAMSLDDLRGLLRPGEAYYKMTVVGDAVYAIWVSQTGARAWRIGAAPAALERDVNALRRTVVTVENGQTVTYPFDAERSHALYGKLFQPVAGEMAAVTHLIFEPDGACFGFRPTSSSPTPPASPPIAPAPRVRATTASTSPAWPGSGATGISRPPCPPPPSATSAAWRRRGPSGNISASARMRRPHPSSRRPPPRPRPARTAPGRLRCGTSRSRPRAPYGEPSPFPRRPGGSRSDHRSAFTDSAIKAREDLAQYRVLHFATHGLVDAPREDCPARPALLTSFGGADSDGLLTFAEIFELRIDADLVILSACDTAGGATAAATQEAGVASGGDFALDGLVRAFVGAGGRSIIASHWPVPDDYDATKRLISGLFTAAPGEATALALRRAQRALMDDPATSHPYYWSGFAIVGDGARPVVPAPGGASGPARTN